MESTETAFKFEKGKIYYFICYALVSGGKSTFYDHILSKQEDEQFKKQYKIFYVSSDKVRADLAEKFHQEHQELTYDECFEKVGKSTAREFDSQIMEFKKDKDPHKINIVLVDKNYPQGIGKFQATFCKDRKNNIVMVFLPRIENPITFKKDDKTFYYPYSIDYVIQCYLRLKHRTNHETLNGGTDKSKYIYLSFLRLFQGFNFERNLKGKHIKEDHSNVYLQHISFTDESHTIPFDEEYDKFFKEVMIGLKGFDFEYIEHHSKDEILAFFDSIEKKYDSGEVPFFQDTRGIIKSEVDQLLPISELLE